MWRKSILLLALTVLVTELAAPLSHMNYTTFASTSNPVSIQTQNVILKSATSWEVESGNNGETKVADEVFVYFGNGVVSGNLLPIFIINVGSVSASGNWYEDDAGLNDPNGPTMVQYINITNNPPNTWIPYADPNGYWTSQQYESESYTLSATVSATSDGIGASGTAAVTTTYYVYLIEGQMETPNYYYVRVWNWALNDQGYNSVAQTTWCWPSSVLVYTPSQSSALWPSNTINFTAMTFGNFWCTFSTWHGGAGWIITYYN